MLKALPEVKDIIKNLESVEAQGKSNVFHDWVEIMLCAFSAPAQEDRYMKLIQPYTDKRNYKERAIDQLAGAMASLMIATQKSNDDVLGTVYEEFSMGNKSRKQALGQFFTPIHICKMMALMVIDPSDNIQTVHDPACGSGRMLIHAAKLLHPNSCFVGIDKDSICGDITALNLLFFNLNGMVLCGDTLSMEFYAGYRTYRTPTGGVLKLMSNEEVKRNSYQVVEARENSTKQEKSQLTMF